MLTGNREPTGVELHMNLEDAKRLLMAVEAAAELCERLIATGPHGERPCGSLLHQLPNAAIKALRDESAEHRHLGTSIRGAMSDATWRMQP